MLAEAQPMAAGETRHIRSSRLRAIAALLGFSQAEIARRLGHRNQTTVNRWFKRDTNAGYEHVRDLAHVLRVREDDLTEFGRSLSDIEADLRGHVDGAGSITKPDARWRGSRASTGGPQLASNPGGRPAGSQDTISIRLHGPVPAPSGTLRSGRAVLLVPADDVGGVLRAFAVQVSDDSLEDDQDQIRRGEYLICDPDATWQTGRLHVFSDGQRDVCARITLHQNLANWTDVVGDVRQPATRSIDHMHLYGVVFRIEGSRPAS